MPAKYHKQIILLEAESTKQDSASPGSFLAKIKSVVEDLRSPGLSCLPLSLRPRVPKFRPRTRAHYLKRQIRLRLPKFNEQKARDLEKVFAFALLALAAFLLKPETPETGKASTNSGTEHTQSADLDEAIWLEVPMLDSMAANPLLLEQMAPQSKRQAFSRFHSYADPRKRFDFSRTAPDCVPSLQNSSSAACSLAGDFQQSMPVMLRQSTGLPQRSPKALSEKQLYRKALNHPLCKRMESQVKQQAFQNYVDRSSLNITSMPLSKVMHQYRSMANVLSEGCGQLEESCSK